MNRLSHEERFAILKLATEIASEAAKNPNVVWMIEFQEQLVESLYRKMTSLLEEPKAKRSSPAPESERALPDDDGDDTDGEDPEPSHHEARRPKPPRKAR